MRITTDIDAVLRVIEHRSHEIETEAHAKRANQKSSGQRTETDQQTRQRHQLTLRANRDHWSRTETDQQGPSETPAILARAEPRPPARP